MKKYLWLLTVFVLAFSLAVPVGAVKYNEKELPELPADVSDFPVQVIYHDSTATYLIMHSGTVVYESANNRIVFKGPATFCVYQLTNATWEQLERSNMPTNDTKVTGLASNTLDWSLNDIKDTSGNVFYEGTVPEIPVCDGSSCPATDVNFDDICDDCGMPLAYNLRVAPNTYEVVVEHSDSLTLKYSYTETLAGTSFNAVYNDNRITVSFDNPVNHYQYKLVDGEWTDYASYPNQYGTHTISLSGDASILASDMDIYDSNGDLFFQNPLWMTVEKVTQGEMENLTSETAGTMKTLVVCGVGLMACLMALSLFGKRWLLFLR